MENLLNLDREYLLDVFNKPDFVLEKGEGVYLYDTKGKKYLDFVSGIAVNLFGHNDKGLVDVISKQAKKLIHVSNIYHNRPQIELAKKLVNNSLGKGKVFFSNSGTESNEGAIKFARIFSIKTKGASAYNIVSANNSFHGRTFGSLSITGQSRFWKNLGPIMRGVQFVDYNKFDDIKARVDKDTAAVILEPIQAEGGIISGDVEYFKAVRKLCDDNGALMIIDEVQTGMCRTGSFFAYEKFGIKPDIITMAKGLGHGLALGAIIVNDRVAETIEKGMHGSTLGGNPLATAVGNYVVDRLLDEDYAGKVKETGGYFFNKLYELKEEFSGLVCDVVGEGLILGLKMKESADVVTILNKMTQKGYLLARAGSDVVRFVPSLIIEKKHIDDMIGELKNCIKSL